MDYINRLDNFDGQVVGVGVGAKLYVEAIAMVKKFDLNVQIVNVLLDNIQNIDWVVEFAAWVEEDEVWSSVGKAQLKKGLLMMQLNHLSKVMMVLNSMKSSIKLLMLRHMKILSSACLW